MPRMIETTAVSSRSSSSEPSPSCSSTKDRPKERPEDDSSPMIIPATAQISRISAASRPAS